jgi:hypothetical protein
MDKSRAALLAITMIAVGVLAGAGTVKSTEKRATLSIAEGVPNDFEDLARATWDRFTDAFPARRKCLVPVTVDAAWDLADRAVYDPGRRLVTVRIPGTAPNLQASLVHELAHHLEFTCPAQKAMRAAFLRAQDLAVGAAWFKGPTWERTPSEQWAEATAEFVLHRRPAHGRITVTDAAVNAISDWATGN